MPKTDEKKPLDRNSQLMKECGSKEPYSWEPEPTDQIRYQMNRGDAIAQVVGWVKWHTTRGVLREGKIHRSPWAVNDNGKPLSIKRAAEDLGWKYQTALNNFYAAEQEGLIRIERTTKGSKEPGRIGLAADIPKSRRKKGELHNSVQSAFPTYLLEKIQALSEVDRRRFENAYARYRQWSKEVFQDAAAEVREYQALAENTMMQAFSLEKKYDTKRRIKKTAISVALPEIPDFVQSVQSEVCTKLETGTVQSYPQTPKIAATPTEKQTSETAPRVPSSETESKVKNNPVGRSVSPKKTDLPTAAQSLKDDTPSIRAEAIRAMLARTLSAKLKDVPGTRIIWLVLEKLGNASLESLEGRIMRRMDAITSYGMIPGLAADVAAAAQQPATEPKPAAKKLPAWAQELYDRQQQEKAS